MKSRAPGGLWTAGEDVRDEGSAVVVRIVIEDSRKRAAAGAAAHARENQKPITPSSITPWNLPPWRMFASGKPLYSCVTYSAFIRTFGVTNQPPATCHRSAPTSPGMPAIVPFALL